MILLEMKNKITVKTLNTQYSEITVTKKCACDKGRICVGVSLTERPIYEECFNCKGTGKITKKHIVSNNGWRPLSFWVDKFENEGGVKNENRKRNTI